MKIAVKDTYGTDGVGVRRFVRAGDAVPPGLADIPDSDVRDTAPGDPSGPTGTTVVPDAAAEPIVGDYDSHSAEALQVEATRRGLTVEGTGKDGNVLKGDLVAALEGSD